MAPFYRSSRVCVLLTGASRGFGVALATTFAEHYRDTFSLTAQEPTSGSSNDADQLMFILLARNATQLSVVAQNLRMIDSRIKVHTIACDLSTEQAIQTVEEFFRNNTLLFEHSNFGHYVLLHNAGSIGDTHLQCKSISYAQKRDDYYRLNVFSVMEITAIFLGKTDPSLGGVAATRSIINISSLAAIQPFTGLVDYCMGKAAREAYFRQLVHELAEDKAIGLIRVLNYAPGPLETDMFDTLRTDSLVSKAFQKIDPLTTTQSAVKLMKLLAEDSYADGAHVDYYDVE